MEGMSQDKLSSELDNIHFVQAYECLHEINKESKCCHIISIYYKNGICIANNPIMTIDELKKSGYLPFMLLYKSDDDNRKKLQDKYCELMHIISENKQKNFIKKI